MSAESHVELSEVMPDGSAQIKHRKELGCNENDSTDDSATTEDKLNDDSFSAKEKYIGDSKFVEHGAVGHESSSKERNLEHAVDPVSTNKLGEESVGASKTTEDCSASGENKLKLEYHSASVTNNPKDDSSSEVDKRGLEIDPVSTMKLEDGSASACKTNKLENVSHAGKKSLGMEEDQAFGKTRLDDESASATNKLGADLTPEENKLKENSATHEADYIEIPLDSDSACAGAHGKPEGDSACGGKKSKKEKKPFKLCGCLARQQDDEDKCVTFEVPEPTSNPEQPQMRSVTLHLMKLIGKGNFGKVFLAQEMLGPHPDNLYALKICWLGNVDDEEELDRRIAYANREMTILSTKKHPFIVDLIYAWYKDGKSYLAMEYMCGGDLMYWFTDDAIRSEESCHFYLAKVILVLEHLHSNGVKYRDLKPDNIMLDEKGHIRLTDFGLCYHDENATRESKTRSVVGTIHYIAPEIATTGGHGSAVDWWSLGIMFYEMIYDKFPFDGESHAEIMQKIQGEDLVLPEYTYKKVRVTPEAKSLIRGLLMKNPKERLGGSSEDARPIKDHPFFRGVDWSKVLKKQCLAPVEPGRALDSNFPKFKGKEADNPPIHTYNRRLDTELSKFSYMTSSRIKEWDDALQFQTAKFQKNDVRSPESYTMNEPERSSSSGVSSLSPKQQHSLQASPISSSQAMTDREPNPHPLNTDLDQTNVVGSSPAASTSPGGPTVQQADVVNPSCCAPARNHCSII